MGSWRLLSSLTARRIMIFPSRVMMYIKQNGMENHMWRSSRPGMPVRRKGKELVLVWLGLGMAQVEQVKYLFLTLIPCNTVTERLGFCYHLVGRNAVHTAVFRHHAI